MFVPSMLSGVRKRRMPSAASGRNHASLIYPTTSAALRGATFREVPRNSFTVRAGLRASLHGSPHLGSLEREVIAIRNTDDHRRAQEARQHEEEWSEWNKTQSFLSAWAQRAAAEEEATTARLAEEHFIAQHNWALFCGHPPPTLPQPVPVTYTSPVAQGMWNGAASEVVPVPDDFSYALQRTQQQYTVSQAQYQTPVPSFPQYAVSQVQYQAPVPPFRQIEIATIPEDVIMTDAPVLSSSESAVKSKNVAYLTQNIPKAFGGNLVSTRPSASGFQSFVAMKSAIGASGGTSTAAMIKPPLDGASSESVIQHTPSLEKQGHAATVSCNTVPKALETPGGVDGSPRTSPGETLDARRTTQMPAGTSSGAGGLEPALEPDQASSTTGATSPRACSPRPRLYRGKVVQVVPDRPAGGRSRSGGRRSSPRRDRSMSPDSAVGSSTRTGRRPNGHAEIGEGEERRGRTSQRTHTHTRRERSPARRRGAPEDSSPAPSLFVVRPQEVEPARPSTPKQHDRPSSFWANARAPDSPVRERASRSRSP